MQKISGKKIANNILFSLQKKINNLKVNPVLAIILVGDDKASHLYVKLKQETGKKIGLGFKVFSYPDSITEKFLIQKIKELNNKKEITGIIVQLPLPSKIDRDKIIQSVHPSKDADGFHPENIEKFLKGKEIIEPVFPSAIRRLINEAERKKCWKKTDLFQRKALIISQSLSFFRIMKASLQKRNWKNIRLIKCQEWLKNKKRFRKEMKKAHLIITACGKENLFQANDLRKEEVMVVDGGIIKKGKKVKGDFFSFKLENNLGCYSPVPQGVGPVTVACLLKNVVELAQNQIRENN